MIVVKLTLIVGTIIVWIAIIRTIIYIEKEMTYK